MYHTAPRPVEPLSMQMQPLTICTYDVDVDPVFDTLDKTQRRTPISVFVVGSYQVPHGIPLIPPRAGR